MMKTKLLFLKIVVLGIVFSLPMLAQLPQPTFTDPVGDVDSPAADVVAGYFVQQGDSLLVGFTMAAPFAQRITGWSLSEFLLDTDFDPSTGQFAGNEDNVDFHDYGGGHWFGSMYLLWDQAKSTFTTRAITPATVTADGKTMYYKFSLVGTGWEDFSYKFSGWYKGGLSWHQVPHYGGDETDWQLISVDVSQVTQLVDKAGTNCIIKVPAPYGTTADAKNITGVVDEMVNLVRSKIGTIAESDKKFSVNYENFTNYAAPIVYGLGGNQFGCRIPGNYWVAGEQPNWLAMLNGVVDQTIKDLSSGLREALLVQEAYQRPIPGYGEGWYCTDDDSINGFKWDTYHKWTMKALLGNAYENCYTYYIAESMTNGEAKTAIMNKKAEMAAAWTGFTGTAKDLTPEIMTGLLLSLSADLSWTEGVFKTIIPDTFSTTQSANNFTQVVNNYLRNQNFVITSSDDFLTQAHHSWYKTITAVQTAAIDLAMGKDLYSALKGITGFPIDKAVYTDAKNLLNPVNVYQDKYQIDDTVPYVWNDIISKGTELEREQFSSPWAKPDLDDGRAGPIPMGIGFNFYGAVFNNIYIGVNAQCSFTDTISWITSGTYGTTIPGMGWNNILCPLACDIMGEKAYPAAPYNSATGKIYYYRDDITGTFTVQYQHMTNHVSMLPVDGVFPDTTLTFQIVLDPKDGSITYYYKDLGIAPEPTAKRATVGIQPGKDGGLGRQYYGGNLPANGYPRNRSAIKFYQPAVTGIKHVLVNQPVEYSLMQNFPNPFNPTTSISFALPTRAKVSLAVYDLLGRNVANLVNNQIVESGYHQFQWDASNLSSGIYFYRLEVAGQSNLTKKCILMK
jgi:hypothetical protein